MKKTSHGILKYVDMAACSDIYNALVTGTISPAVHTAYTVGDKPKYRTLALPIEFRNKTNIHDEIFKLMGSPETEEKTETGYLFLEGVDAI